MSFRLLATSPIEAVSSPVIQLLRFSKKPPLPWRLEYRISSLLNPVFLRSLIAYSAIALLSKAATTSKRAVDIVFLLTKATLTYFYRTSQGHLYNTILATLYVTFP